MKKKKEKETTFIMAGKVSGICFFRVVGAVLSFLYFLHVSITTVLRVTQTEASKVSGVKLILFLCLSFMWKLQ